MHYNLRALAFLSEAEGRSLWNDIEETKESVLDVTALGGDLQGEAEQFLVDSYVWSAACLFALSVGKFLGARLFRPILALLIAELPCFTISLLLLPQLFARWTEEQQRVNLLPFSVLLGLLTGYGLSNRQMSTAAPPPILMALSLALLSRSFASSLTTDRRQFLATVLGTALSIHILYGLFTGSLSLRFCASVLFWFALTAIDLQLKLERLRSCGSNSAAKLSPKDHLSGLVTAVIFGVAIANPFASAVQKTEPKPSSSGAILVPVAEATN